MCKTISPFFYYSELKRYEHKKSFIGHQYKGMFSLQFLLVYFYIVEAYPISFIRTKSDWYKIVHRFVFLVCNCMVIQRK